VAARDWPGWRGVHRDGHTAWLPDRLPAKFRTIWRRPLSSRGLGGVAATDKLVVVSCREQNDSADAWRCLDADTGAPIWTIRYPAPGGLDFGNSPRATALFHNDLVFLYGAFGHLHAVNAATGTIVWKKDTRAEYGDPGELPWGQCGSPLIVSDKLIINPGGAKAGVVALNPKTGAEIWKTPGRHPGYGSLNAAVLGGVEQIVGHDHDALHGWDAATGHRLWTVTPARPKDFNVPTPIVWNGHLIVTTENNGTRMFRFQAGGKIDPAPVAVNMELRPDTHTPVVVGERLIGVFNGVRCLDLKNRLHQQWLGDAEEFSHYTTAIASDRRVLLITFQAEAVLIDPLADAFTILDRQRLLDDEVDFYAHPAVVGKRIYVRGSDAVYCVGME
jgi:outer membrane protein assembly factor BamB